MEHAPSSAGILLSGQLGRHDEAGNYNREVSKHAQKFTPLQSLMHSRPRTSLLAFLLILSACATTPRGPAQPATPAGSAAPTALTAITAAITDPKAQQAESVHGVVASATPEATAVGARVLAEGGNAIDAAVAIGFALAVTEPSMSGLGGRASVLVRAVDGTSRGIDGLNQVPKSYRADSGIPDVYERAAIPGVPAALASALAQHGTWPLARVIAPAIELAANGFIIGEAEAGRWASAREELAKFGAGRGTYLKDDGTTWRAGDRVTNPLLARTLRRLATEGVASFYRGAIAAEIDRDMAAHGGFLRSNELAAYEALPSIVVTGAYRGYQLASNFRPAAGHAVIEALQILEDVAVPGAAEPARWAAVVGQAMQLAMADRAQRRGTEEESAAWLTSRDHARTRAKELIVPERIADLTPDEIIPFQGAAWFNPPGTMVTAPTDREATTHYAVTDREGRFVSITQSLGPAMGTRLVAPGLGFIYATRLGTVPGSRPASTIAPTIVVPPNDASIVALGGAGDARIISAVIQVISRMIDHHLTLAEAMAAPRVHPDAMKSLTVEEGPVAAWTAADRARLEKWGFKIVGAPSGFFGRVHAVSRRPTSGATAIGVAEPRWTGGTAGPK
jgi:gamma-glutamyltranspeptidase/glutathione hydrolase